MIESIKKVLVEVIIYCFKKVVDCFFDRKPSK